MEKIAVQIFHQWIRPPAIAALTVMALLCQGSRLNGSDGLVSGAGKDERFLKKWIAALSFAESGNRDWIVHRDRDGRYYYGCLQFREKTFRYFVQKFNLGATTEDAEVMDLIFDCAFQKRLAAQMIHDNPENWKHWRTTVQRRIGLPPGAKMPLESSVADQSGTSPK
jgi:hypothetical protein